jgi:hypothetical protein
MNAADLWNLTRGGRDPAPRALASPPRSPAAVVVIADAVWQPTVTDVARRLEHWGMLCRCALRWTP